MNLKLLLPALFCTGLSLNAHAQLTRLSDINTSGDASPLTLYVYSGNIYFLAKPATDRQEWYKYNISGNTITQQTNDHSQLTSAVIFRPTTRIYNNVFTASSKNNNTSPNLQFARFDLTTGTEVQWNPTNNTTVTGDPITFVVDSATSDVYTSMITATNNQIYKWTSSTGVLSQFSTIGNAGVGSNGQSGGGLAVIGNNVYTVSYGGTGNNYNYPIRIAKTNGATYTDIQYSSAYLYEARSFTQLNGKLYFAARNSGAGYFNLYCYNPSDNTCAILTNYTQTLATGNLGTFAVAPDGTLLVNVSYYNTSPVQGEMLRIDPATNNVTHINGGIITTGATYTYAFSKGNFVYFTQLSGSNRILLKYDLTNGNTTTVIPVGAGLTATANFFVASNNKVYFSGTTATAGGELWYYDVTWGTYGMITDLYAGASPNNAAPSNFAEVNGVLYFAAKEATYGRELYSYVLPNPLSVQLEQLTAVNKGAANVISWKNATEQAGDEMNLQASADGKTFHTITTIQATGKANSSYEYKDEYPVNGQNYYRLQVKDVNGATEYSQVVTAFVQNSTDVFTIHPNPAKEDLHVTCAQAGQLNIVDGNGSRLSQTAVHAGSNKIDVRSLPSGWYVMQYTGSNGHTVSQRFFKQ